MAFLRFVTLRRDPDSGVDAGVFRLAHELLEGGTIEEPQLAVLSEALAWFDVNLKKPERFNRTSSKGFYRRKTGGIAWFRDSATECLSQMYALKGVLEAHGHVVEVIREQRVGYVVYEDDLQVVAEPFADTQTAGW